MHMVRIDGVWINPEHVVLVQRSREHPATNSVIELRTGTRVNVEVHIDDVAAFLMRPRPPYVAT